MRTDAEVFEKWQNECQSRKRMLNLWILLSYLGQTMLAVVMTLKSQHITNFGQFLWFVLGNFVLAFFITWPWWIGLACGSMWVNYQKFSRHCQFCDSKISNQAIVCPYCQKNVQISVHFS